MLHLHQALRPGLPFSEIIVLLVIILYLALTLSPSDPRYTQQLFLVKDYSFELRLQFFFALFFFERHAELNSKRRPLGTIFTCSKIKKKPTELVRCSLIVF